MSDEHDPAGLEWKTPPRSHIGKWVPVADELRRHPGEWAKMPGRHNASMVQEIRRGRPVGFEPAGSFDAKARGIESNGKCDLYVRYVGDPT